MHFIRKKRNLYRDLASTINIKDRGVKIKKNKALSARNLSKLKNNIIVVCVSSGREGKNSV